jgi:hypothetical protein
MGMPATAATGNPTVDAQNAEAISGARSDAADQGVQMALHPANTAGQLAGSYLLGRGLAKIPEAVSAVSNFRPSPNPSIVPPEEMAARNLTNAINPAPQRASQYIQAAQREVPNVIDYANRTGNPLNTQLEFSKAAEGNAKEARTHYEDNILGPNADQRVTAPEGYGGKSYTPGGENPTTTTSLGDIDDRIVAINKELDKPRLNASDNRTALASEAELQAEKSQLTDMLHRSLADLTGLQPEDIANLRQRVGRSYELANDTNAAVTGRGLQEGKPGSLIHGLGAGQLAMKAVDLARGGPTAVADRSFQRAIANFPGQAEPLPQPTGPSKPPASYPGQVAPMEPLPANPSAPEPGANYATRGTRLQTLAEQKGVAHAAQGTTPKAGDVKYANGKAFAYNPETGWWHPQ